MLPKSALSQFKANSNSCILMVQYSFTPSCIGFKQQIYTLFIQYQTINNNEIPLAVSSPLLCNFYL